MSENDNWPGVCPECGKNDGYLNIGRDHWFYCRKHRVKWCIGSNLFSSWRRETREEWEENAKRLEGYREIDCNKAITTQQEEETDKEAHGNQAS